jgi:hypothetical protein
MLDSLESLDSLAAVENIVGGDVDELEAPSTGELGEVCRDRGVDLGEISSAGDSAPGVICDGPWIR